MAARATDRYLAFQAKLYDLAATFEQGELRSIRRLAEVEGNVPAATFATVLMDLRGDKTAQRRSATRKRSLTRDEGLPGLLASKSVFPSNSDLVEFASRYVEVKVKAKESRERLVGRVVRAVGSLRPSGREKFAGALAERVRRQNGGSDFVSRWSKVIRDL